MKGRADRFRQDHPRHHRTPRGAAGAAERAGAARADAEDGRIRPAHRRRGARFQQPADGRHRRMRAAKKRLPEDPRTMRSLNAIRWPWRGATLTRQLLTFARRQNSMDPRPWVQAPRAHRHVQRHAGKLAWPAPSEMIIEIRRRDLAGRRWNASELELAMVDRAERARCDAGGRRHYHHGGRTGGCATTTGEGLMRRIRCPAGQHDTGTGIAPEGWLRCSTLLHHQADRQGQRPRPLPGAWLRAPVRRRVKWRASWGKARHHDLPPAQRQHDGSLNVFRCGSDRGSHSRRFSSWKNNATSRRFGVKMYERLDFTPHHHSFSRRAALAALRPGEPVNLVLLRMLMYGRTSVAAPSLAGKPRRQTRICQ